MTWSRRRFVELGSSAASIAAIWGCSPESSDDASSAPPPPDRMNPTGPRRVLAEPGPMLPPVPAILLSINGAEGDPDEISVLWTFVLNGNPPQIGVSAGTEHLARQLLEEHAEFVLNVPTAGMVEAFDTIDMNSSRVGDRFEMTATTAVGGSVDESGRVIVPGDPFQDQGDLETEQPHVGTELSRDPFASQAAGGHIFNIVYGRDTSPLK